MVSLWLFLGVLGPTFPVTLSGLSWVTGGCLALPWCDGNRRHSSGCAPSGLLLSGSSGLLEGLSSEVADYGMEWPLSSQFCRRLPLVVPCLFIDLLMTPLMACLSWFLSSVMGWQHGRPPLWAGQYSASPVLASTGCDSRLCRGCATVAYPLPVSCGAGHVLRFTFLHQGYIM